MNFMRCLAFPVLLVCLGSAAQNTGTGIGRLIVGAEDSSVPQPLRVIPSGHKDPAAMALISHHLQLTGSLLNVAVHAWGNIDIDRGARASTGTVDMYFANANKFRMDVKTPDTTYSIRLTDSRAAIQRESESVRQLPASEATFGILPALKLTQDLLSNQETSIMDEGTINVAGVELHRVAISVPTVSKANGGQGASEIVDLYFDPSTGVLSKTVRCQSQFKSLHGSPNVVIDTYSSFTTVGSVSIPAKISESVNGQHLWTMSLSNITIANPQADVFVF